MVETAAQDLSSNVVYLVPEIKEYWKEDDGLQEIGQGLVNRWPRQFGHIGAEEVWWGWRKNGGREARKDRLGGVLVVPAASPLMHFARKGLMIWLSADHIRARNLNDSQIEALLFRLMMGIGKNAKGLPVKRAPDFAGYRAELEQYGYWSDDLQKIANVQLGLGFSDAEDNEDASQQPEQPETPSRNGSGRGSRRGHSPEGTPAE